MYLLLFNILCMVISSIFSVSHGSAWLLSIRSVSVICLACGLSFVLPWTMKRFKRFLAVLCTLGVLASGIAFIQLFAGTFNLGFYRADVFREDYFFGWANVASVFFNPNSFGLFLVFSIFSTLIMLALAYRKKHASVFPFLPFYFLILGMQGVALFFTFSRASFLALGLVSILFFKFYNSHILRPYFLTQTVMHLTVCGVVFWNAQESGTLINFSRLLNGRGTLWAEAMQIFRDNSLLGVGLGGWHAITGKILSVHNTYLHVMVELGILGLLAYMALIGYFLWFLVSGIRKTARDSVGSVYLSGILALTLGLLVHQLFESYFLWGVPLFTLYLVLMFPVIGKIRKESETAYMRLARPGLRLLK